jgi:hypothetical protein
MIDLMTRRDSINNGHDGHDGHDNTEHTSHRPGAVRRAIAKAKNSTGLTHDSKASYVDYQDDKPHPHPKVEDIVSTVGFSLIQESMEYLKSPAGLEAMTVILTAQSRVAARLALTEEARQAAQITAQEATAGTYDGAERKTREAWSKIPPSLVTIGFIVIGTYLVLFSVGLLFSLWRFALFGLH